VKSDTITLQ